MEKPKGVFKNPKAKGECQAIATDRTGVDVGAEDVSVSSPASAGRLDGNVSRRCTSRRIQSMKLNRKSAQAGFSLLELLIVVAIILVIAAIAIPNLLAAKRSANQASAVGSLRALVSAQNTYRGNQNPESYADTLAKLGASDAKNNGEPYMDTQWTTVADATATTATGVNGYKFAIVSGDASTFVATAVPVDAGSGGFGYCVSQAGTVHKKAGIAAADCGSSTTDPIVGQ